MGLPRVFFDMAADGNAVGRIVIEVSRSRAHCVPDKRLKICRLEKCGRGEKSKMVEGYGSLSLPPFTRLRMVEIFFLGRFRVWKIDSKPLKFTQLLTSH